MNKLVDAKTVAAATPVTNVVISPPNFQSAKVRIVGTAPYMQNKMSARAKEKMMLSMEEGGRAKKGKIREARDFEKDYQEAIHVSTEGWFGMPASAFRNALVSACRTVGFAMTRAKLCLFVEADGLDCEDSQPLIKINGKPKRRDMAVRMADGSTNIMPRPVWDQWSADVLLKWDADQFSASDVVNLLARVGAQVGIGAGRPDSRNSTGLGFGTFRVEN